MVIAVFAGLRILIISLRKGEVNSHVTGDARKARSGTTINRVDLILMRRSSAI